MSYDPNVLDPPEYDEVFDAEWDEEEEPYDPGPECLTDAELGEALDIYERELDRMY